MLTLLCCMFDCLSASLLRNVSKVSLISVTETNGGQVTFTPLVIGRMIMLRALALRTTIISPNCSSVHVILQLRNIRILVKIRVTLLKERLTALLRLIGEVVEHGSVASEFLNARLTVKFGIETSLDHS